MAEDQQVLADAAIADAVKGRFDVETLGTRAVKGYDKELLVYELRNWDGLPKAGDDPRDVSPQHC